MTQFLKTRTSIPRYPFDFLASTPWSTSPSRKAPDACYSRRRLPPSGFPTPARPLLRCRSSVRSSVHRHDVPTHNVSCHLHVSRPWFRLHELYRRFWRRRDSRVRRHRLSRTRRPALGPWPAVLPRQGLSTFNTHDLPRYRFGHRRNDAVSHPRPSLRAPRSMPLSSPRRLHPPPPAAITAWSHVLRHSLRSSRPNFHVQPSHQASLTQLRSILLAHPCQQIRPTLVVPLSPNSQRRLHDQDQPLDQRYSLSVYRRLRHGFRRVFPGAILPHPLSRPHLAALRAWHQHPGALHHHGRLESLGTLPPRTPVHRQMRQRQECLRPQLRALSYPGDATVPTGDLVSLCPVWLRPLRRPPPWHLQHPRGLSQLVAPLPHSQGSVTDPNGRPRHLKSLAPRSFQTLKFSCDLFSAGSPAVPSPSDIPPSLPAFRGLVKDVQQQAYAPGTPPYRPCFSLPSSPSCESPISSPLPPPHLILGGT